MKRTCSRAICILSILLVASIAESGSSDGSSQDGADKRLSGMSIVGNDEAPKSLVIVPWKSSELGDTPPASRALDDGRRPVDRDVFGRSLDYYRIRSGWEEGRGKAAK